MPRYEVTFSEMNSGGYTNMTDSDYRALDREGWYDYGDYAGQGRAKVIHAPSADIAEMIAQDEWERVTTCSMSDYWCNCCGPRYDFMAEEINADPRGDLRAALEEASELLSEEAILIAAAEFAMERGIHDIYISDAASRILAGR